MHNCNNQTQNQKSQKSQLLTIHKKPESTLIKEFHNPSDPKNWGNCQVLTSHKTPEYYFPKENSTTRHTPKMGQKSYSQISENDETSKF